MRSTVRVFWLIFSFWFGPSLVVPEMIDQCPVHHFAATAATGHASHAGMQGKTGSPTNHSSHRGCTCLDQGCATAVASPATADVRFTPRVRFISITTSIAHDKPVVASPSLLLPPTTGPPPRA